MSNFYGYNPNSSASNIYPPSTIYPINYANNTAEGLIGEESVTPDIMAANFMQNAQSTSNSIYNTPANSQNTFSYTPSTIYPINYANNTAEGLVGELSVTPSIMGANLMQNAQNLNNNSVGFNQGFIA